VRGARSCAIAAATVVVMMVFAVLDVLCVCIAVTCIASRRSSRYRGAIKQQALLNMRDIPSHFLLFGMVLVILLLLLLMVISVTSSSSSPPAVCIAATGRGRLAAVAAATATCMAVLRLLLLSVGVMFWMMLIGAAVAVIQ
jgi:hypothetical protein